MIKAVHHGGFWVSSIDAILPFYRDVLGMDVILDATMTAPFVETLTGVPKAVVRAVILMKDGHGWEFLQLVDPPAEPLPADAHYAHTGRGHVCFEVDDIEAAYQRLQKEGIKFVCPPLDQPELKMFYCEDPGGNRVEIVELKTL